MALDRARLEQVRMAKLVRKMVDGIMPAIFGNSPKKLANLSKSDEEVDALHVAIVRYLGHLSQQQLVSPQMEMLSEGIAVTNYLENIGDVIETDLVGDGETLLQKDLKISDSTREILKPLQQKVRWAFGQIVSAIEDGDQERVRSVINAKKEIKLLSTQANLHLSKRLAVSPGAQIEVFRIESEIVENLKRIFYLTRRIAKTLEDNPPNGDEPEEERD